MGKRYVVRLADPERALAARLADAPGVPARVRVRAAVLLAADAGLSDLQIAAARATSVATVQRTRRRFITDGFAAAVGRTPHWEPAAVTAANTVYLTGLAPEDVERVRDDFAAYPFPGWQLAELEAGVPPPVSLLAGHAILVVGCGGSRPGHTEAMWLLRLLACGCPWVAVADAADRPDADLCEAAGAVAYLARPFSPAKLRELIWYNAIPQVGRTAVLPLSCDRLVRYFAVLRADVLLKFTAGGGRTGYVALQDGQPTHARLLDGPVGPAALTEVLGWGRGRVLGQPLPPDVKPNLPARPDAWADRLTANRASLSGISAPIPGGREACDRLARELTDVTRCLLIDARSGRVAGRPTGPADRDGEADLTAAVLELLQGPADEAVALTRGGWFAAARSGAYALAVWASGSPQLGLLGPAFAAAAGELEQRAGITVEPSELVAV